MSLFSQFKTSPDLEVKGILFDYGVNARVRAKLLAEGATPQQATERAAVTFRVARAGGANTKFQRVLERKLKPYRRQIQAETMENELAERLLREAYAETVIIGWENVDGEDGVVGRSGESLPYTVQHCFELMTALPDLFKDLQAQAGSMALYRAEVLEADAKN